MEKTFGTPLKMELHDLAKGCAGAAIFGTPLLYTMEVWFDGKTYGPGFHLIFLTAMIPVNMLLVYIAGYHRRWSKTFGDTLRESFSSCGLGILLSAGILWLIGAVEEVSAGGVGTILFEGLIMSLGISFANFKFGQSDSAQGFSLKQRLRVLGQVEKTLSQELAAGTVGAIVFSLNVAPTEEVTVIASRLSQSKLLLMLLTEYLLSYVILSVADKKRAPRATFQRLEVHALHTTALTLLICAVFVFSMGFGGPAAQSELFFSMVIALALPGVVGAFAGRIIL